MSNPTGPGLDGMTVEERLAARERCEQLDKLYAPKKLVMCNQAIMGGINIYKHHKSGALLGVIEEQGEESQAFASLFVHARTDLPKALAQIDALEELLRGFVAFHSGHVLPPELQTLMVKARAALTEGVRDEEDGPDYDEWTERDGTPRGDI